MGPYYDSIYLMVRQLPEPPDFPSEADVPRSDAPICAVQGTAPATRLRGPCRALFKELLRVLKQPVRRAWAVD